MRHGALALLCVGPCLLPVTALAQTAPAAVSAETSLQDAAVALGQRYDRLYGQKDVAGMASLYASDGELVSPSGNKIKGREALEQYYRKRFASGASGHRIVIEETHPLGDTGYSVANFSVNVPDSESPSTLHIERGHITAVYRHDASGWHFALVQPSVMPERGG